MSPFIYSCWTRSCFDLVEPRERSLFHRSPALSTDPGLRCFVVRHPPWEKMGREGFPSSAGGRVAEDLAVRKGAAVRVSSPGELAGPIRPLMPIRVGEPGHRNSRVSSSSPASRLLIRISRTKDKFGPRQIPRLSNPSQAKEPPLAILLFCDLASSLSSSPP